MSPAGRIEDFSTRCPNQSGAQPRTISGFGNLRYGSALPLFRRRRSWSGFALSLGGLCVRGGRGFFLCCVLVLLAAVVRNIKAAAFEQQARAAADIFRYTPAAPFFAAAKLFWTVLQRFGRDRLECFEFMSALLAMIFVGRHKSPRLPSDCRY